LLAIRFHPEPAESTARLIESSEAEAFEDEFNLKKPHHLLVPSHARPASNFKIGVNKAQTAGEVASKASTSHKVANRSIELAGKVAERLRQSVALKRPSHRKFLTTIGSRESEQY
jgi:hypothetical protein